MSAAFALAVMGSGTALACLNDSETPKFEEEFKKQYEPPTDPNHTVPWHFAWVGAGGTLMGGAAGYLIRPKSSD